MKRLGALLDAQVVPAPVARDTDGQLLPRDVCLDRGDDYDAWRETAQAHGYRPPIPPKASADQPLPPPGDPARPPPRRWVVEVGHAWFNRFRRLLIPLRVGSLSFGGAPACMPGGILPRERVRH